MYISNINASSIKIKEIIGQIEVKDSIRDIQTQECAYLLYLKTGQLTATHHNKTIILKVGDMLVINPHTQFSIQADDNSKYYLVRVTGIMITSNISMNSQEMIFHINESHPTLPYFELALKEKLSPQPGSDLIIRRLIECIVIFVLRNPDYSIKEPTDQTQLQEIKEIQSYIRGHYADKVTLEELATVIRLNKFKLIRIFKQATGLSPIDYLIHVRIEEAKNMLIDTDTPVAEISEKVGFHSPSHFAKAFKALNHITPTEYRKKHLTNR